MIARRLVFLSVFPSLTCATLGLGPKNVSQSALDVPPAPEEPSECVVKGEIRKLDQGLQSEAPIPAPLALSGKSYLVAWARTEAVEAPEIEEEDGVPVIIPEIGPLQMAKINPGAKKASGLRRLTSERIGTRKLSLIPTGTNTSIVFEDETGVHFFQVNAAGRPAGEAVDLRGARSPSISFHQAGGLWLAWAESCGPEGALRLLKISSRDQVDPAQAFTEPAPNLLCESAGLALTASGSRLALAWASQEPPDKKGRPGPTSLHVMLGDGAKSTFGDAFSFPTPEGIIGGPALAWGKDAAEVAVVWVAEGGALRFATLDTNGALKVAPRFVPGSLGAVDLSPDLIFWGQYYAVSWSSGEMATLALLDEQGEMPTAPLLLGPGERPSLARGVSTKEYGFTFWRPEEGLISSKALVFGSASCFGKKKKGK